MRANPRPSGMGLLAIVWTVTEPAIRVPLPVRVIRVLEHERFCAQQDRPPAELLARYYQEWEAEAGPNAQPGYTPSATCFRDPYRPSALLFWALANFSDANFRLTEWQRNALILHTLEESTRIRRAYVSHLMSTVTA